MDSDRNEPMGLGLVRKLRATRGDGHGSTEGGRVRDAAPFLVGSSRRSGVYCVKGM